jgi:hypothetical protein
MIIIIPLAGQMSAQFIRNFVYMSSCLYTCLFSEVSFSFDFWMYHIV